MHVFLGEKNPGSSQYYYTDFRYHIRYPWPRKDIASALPLMEKVALEDRASFRANLAKETGYTGLSIILHRLHHLYEFDVLQDLVYDAMHNVPLNVVSHHLHYYLENEILSPPTIEKKLKMMPWTPGMYYSYVCQQLLLNTAAIKKMNQRWILHELYQLSTS